MAILVIDDSPDDLTLVEYCLKGAGYQVVTANSAEEGMRYLLEVGEGKRSVPIDLILLDIMMDGLDGLDACRRIKATGRLKEIPIVMVSIDTMPGTIQLAFRRGAVDYIRKPVIKAELLAKVAMVLKVQEDAPHRTEPFHAQQGERIQRDPVTGIMTWGEMDKIFQREWEIAIRERLPMSLIVFRPDDFKVFNDKYGYQTGDDCLRMMAQTAQGMFTQSGQFVARYRGAEFVVILVGTEEEAAKTMADRLREAIEDLDLGLTLALGTATVTADGHASRDMLLALAKNHLGKTQ
ncbi:MAG: hypothetical protein NTNFB02_28140 [Nitrospira sp.]